MDTRLISLLQSLLLNVEVINSEIKRLRATEQFTGSPECKQLLAQSREIYARGLLMIKDLEKSL